MHLSDLFDVGLLQEMVDARFVRRFEHDNGDLVGYDYTSAAQFEKLWNPVTLNCRGLLTSTDGQIVARPFPKFFNLGEQPEKDVIYLGQPFYLTEKVDGSLGIFFCWEGQNHVATRGSFHSDQAQWATDYVYRWAYDPARWLRVTPLFEIVYPENRIVVDYGDYRGLMYLGAVDWVTGRTVMGHEFPLSMRAVSYAIRPGDDLNSIRVTWAHLDTGNFEGFVATFADGHRVKIKLDEYVRLHRIMSSTSNRTIWEALRAGTDVAQMFDAVPDEFLKWAHGIVDDLNLAYDAVNDAAKGEYQALVTQHGTSDRKTFALAAKESPNAPILFALLDGKAYADTIWKRLRPETLGYPPLGGGGEPS